ncbi:hypothetical protein [Nocardia sp. NBC_01329]|uniref:hypothetical protein n=1 Tax=Nocardia sp. NBC_01329 TaxID=2903594 RepID=UPI002E0EF4A7|nr:hypothetical protein OG405_04725 [Nocardia sp. NBC_01329]
MPALPLGSADPEIPARFHLDLLGGKTLWRKESGRAAFGRVTTVPLPDQQT